MGNPVSSTPLGYGRTELVTLGCFPLFTVSTGPSLGSRRRSETRLTRVSSDLRTREIFERPLPVKCLLPEMVRPQNIRVTTRFSESTRQQLLNGKKGSSASIIDSLPTRSEIRRRFFLLLKDCSRKKDRWNLRDRDLNILLGRTTNAHFHSESVVHYLCHETGSYGVEVDQDSRQSEGFSLTPLRPDDLS